MALRPERHPGAEDYHEIDDRPGQHVRDAARQRQALAQEPPHHHDDAAFAHREKESHHATDHHGRHDRLRQKARDEFLREKFFQDTRDERAQDDERQRKALILSRKREIHHKQTQGEDDDRFDLGRG